VWAGCYGTAAIAGGVQVQQAAYRGHPANGRFRLTVVLVGGEKAWSIVNVRLSAMPDQ